MSEVQVDDFGLKDIRNQWFWQCWVWETSIEGRRTTVAAKRLEKIFFISERRINDLAAEMGGRAYKRDAAKTLSGSRLFTHKAWEVYQEVRMGGHEEVVVVCQGVEVGRCPGGRLEGTGMVRTLEKRVRTWLMLAST